MTRKISSDLRGKIAARAHYRCEYCRIPRQDSLIDFHVDHIISIKHGGKTQIDNLAYACSDCNYYKGSDLGTYLTENENFTRFFNPRIDDWSDHFKVIEGAIQHKTEIAEVTIRIFQMNLPERVDFRKELMMDNSYP